MNEKWFALSVNEIEKKLKTNAASGLSRKAARSRVNRSAGSLFYLPQKSALRMLGELLSDFALILLLLVACISLFFEDFRNGITVLVMLCANLAFFWWMHVRGQRTVEAFEAGFAPMVRVIRGGRLFSVEYRAIVPGDLILLEAGDLVCCDARLITSDHLTVEMRLDKEQTVLLEKFAEGHVRTGENQAQNLTNMVHGGSVVRTGCARAMVTAVGKYTYLGAMTGGIPLPISNKLPQRLERFQKHSFRMNLLLLLAVLPFSLVGLFLSFLNGGTVLLSTAFLTALSIVVTTMSQAICALSRWFYIHPMRRLAYDQSVALIRSVDAADRLASADYVFILDGSALTDGRMHFKEAVFADGNLRIGGAMSDTAKRFSEFVALYYMAATRTVTSGVSDGGLYFTGIREFLEESRVDEGALRLRCSILSYAAGDLTEGYEQVYFRESDVRYCMNVSENEQLISACSRMWVGGSWQPVSEAGRERILQTLRRQRDAHRIPLIFTVSEGMDGAPGFVGALLLEEGIDEAIAHNIKRMVQMGVKPIFFPNDWVGGPKIPQMLLQEGAFSKRMFEQNHVPLTHHFGRIRTYLDFEEADVAYLIRYAHHLKKKVFVLGFSEEAKSLSGEADGWISCAPVRIRPISYFDRELQSVEVVGQQNGESCSQLVKQDADCLIPRPFDQKGGLRALVTLMVSVKGIAVQYSDFIRYLVATQLMRVLLVAIPMLFGHPILDARHVIVCGCILDVFALLMFAEGHRARPWSRKKDYGTCKSIGAYVRGDRPLLWAGLCAVVLALLLPPILGWTGLFGMYHDRVEGSLVSLILLHFIALLCIRYGDAPSELKHIYRNKWLVIAFAFSILFLALCFTWDAFGGLFGIETPLTLPFLAVSLIPAIAYTIVFFCLQGRNRHNGRSE